MRQPWRITFRRRRVTSCRCSTWALVPACRASASWNVVPTRLVGPDFSSEMLRHADAICRWLRSLSRMADVTHLPFADASFDIITHHSFLYLLGNRDALVCRRCFACSSPVVTT